MGNSCGSGSIRRVGILPPLTSGGVTRYRGILVSDQNEIVVTGSLPKGQTTQNVTYWIIDCDTDAIVSQVVLPDRSSQFSRVEMRLKVARTSGRYQIGTFAAKGAFEQVEFLSVRSDPNPPPSNGPTGQSS